MLKPQLLLLIVMVMLFSMVYSRRRGRPTRSSFEELVG